MSALFKFSSLLIGWQPDALDRSALRPCSSVESVEALEAEWKRGGPRGALSPPSSGLILARRPSAPVLMSSCGLSKASSPLVAL
eukprot:4577114-Pyramimonas_sp.AAC.1